MTFYIFNGNSHIKSTNIGLIGFISRLSRVVTLFFLACRKIWGRKLRKEQGIRTKGQQILGKTGTEGYTF